MELAELAGWAGGLLVIARILPQALLARATRNTAGLSTTGVWCWFANDLGWFVYGLQAQMAPLWLSSLVLLALDAAILSAFPPAQLIGSRSRAGLAWLAAVSVAALWSPSLLAVLLLVGAAAGTLPHALEARRSSDLSGLAPWTWKLGVADGALWLVYGVARLDAAVVLYAALTLATSLIVLARVHGTSLAQEASPQLPASPAAAPLG